MPSASFGKPVFFDPRGWRKRVVRTFGLLAAVSIVGPLVFLVISIGSQPVLPQSGLRPVETVAQSPLPGAGLIPPPEPELQWSHARSRDVESGSRAARYGFLVNWDENSFASLKQNASALDVVLAEWLHFTDGAISRDDQRREREMRDWIAANAPGLEILPLINNYDKKKQNWDGPAVAALAATPESRAAFIGKLHAYVQETGSGGLVLDFEDLPAESLANYVALTRELADRLHREKLKLLVAVPANDPRYDYDALAAAADQLIVMTYDEHAAEDAPGPIAGQGWFENALDERFKEMDGSKLIVGIGSYGYDWGRSGDATTISVQEAWKRLEESQSWLHYDPVALNPGFTYTADATHHNVWFLDGTTVYNQVAAALAMEPAGLALWRLGTEDPAAWESFGRGRVPDDSALEALKTIKPGYDVVYRGDGEVLRVTGHEQPGRRTIEFDRTYNLITAEAIDSFPKMLTVSRWGKRADKTLAITFDDGPDPDFTPAILDVLAEKQVKASFFVLGMNANRHGSLLRRIYAEGHDIGSHTFSHPNLGKASDIEIEWEMNATTLLLETTLGIRTVLFRPPFAQGMEPHTVDQARPLLAATRLGYTTIGLRVDPYDWALPQADEIVRRVIAQVEAGLGNVILLHDAGGDRKRTVEALPRMIDALKARGYSFVPIHSLLGVPRDAVMPPTGDSDGLLGRFNQVGFGIVGSIGGLIGTLCVVGLALGSARLVLVAGAALVHRRRELRRQALDWKPPSLAVLVPAFNEEAVICGSIRTLLASDFKDFEILVIDDGSGDRTVAVAREAFAAEPRVRVLAKPNGGKASALNFGLSRTKAEIVVALDADTIFMPDALRLLVRHFADPKVGAVAGATVVGNRVNLITRFQALEYLTSQNLDRRALELVNAITVVPGAIGAWRRSALVGIGGFPEDTLAEDADATISLEREGWRVLYEPQAVARTEAPESLRSFLKQRFRWMFGTLQAAWKHRGALRQRGAPGIRWCALPNIVIFQFSFALISPAMDLAFIWDIVAAWRNAGTSSDGGLSRTAGYWIALQGLELAVAAVALSLDRERQTWHLLPLVVVQRFCYRQLIYATAIRTAFAAVEGRVVGWGKLRRTGQVLARFSGLATASGDEADLGALPSASILFPTPGGAGLLLPGPTTLLLPIPEPPLILRNVAPILIPTRGSILRPSKIPLFLSEPGGLGHADALRTPVALGVTRSIGT